MTYRTASAYLMNILSIFFVPESAVLFISCSTLINEPYRGSRFSSKKNIIVLNFTQGKPNKFTTFTLVQWLQMLSEKMFYACFPTSLPAWKFPCKKCTSFWSNCWKVDENRERIDQNCHISRHDNAKEINTTVWLNKA